MQTKQQIAAAPLAITGRTVTGLFAVTGVRDLVDDVVWPGAFLRTLGDRQGQIMALWAHDALHPPVGVVKSIGEIGRAELPAAVRTAYPGATGGLQAAITYLDTPKGNEILAALRAGVPLGGSFAFDPVRFDFTRAPDGVQVRNLRDVELYEVGPCNWGAMPAAVAAVPKGRARPASPRQQTWLDLVALQLACLEPRPASRS